MCNLIFKVTGDLSQLDEDFLKEALSNSSRELGKEHLGEPEKNIPVVKSPFLNVPESGDEDDGW